MNKFAATISALCLAIYGAAGFWIHIGNETMSPVLFATILAAMILAPFAIIYSAFRLTKDMQKNGMAKAGLVSLAAAAVSLTGFGLWLSAGRRMENGTLFAVIGGVLLACGAAAAVYAVCFFIFAAVRKQAL